MWSSYTVAWIRSRDRDTACNEMEASLEWLLNLLEFWGGGGGGRNWLSTAWHSSGGVLVSCPAAKWNIDCNQAFCYAILWRSGCISLPVPRKCSCFTVPREISGVKIVQKFVFVQYWKKKEWEREGSVLWRRRRRSTSSSNGNRSQQKS